MVVVVIVFARILCYPFFEIPEIEVTGKILDYTAKIGMLEISALVKKKEFSVDIQITVSSKRAGA